jgi:putative peptide zinc metalloprotease protein
MSEAVLPPLREDLSLLRGPVSNGAPTWTLYDPARHRFIRLDWPDFEILSRWTLRTPIAILEALKHETTLQVSQDDVLRFAGFARRAGLLRAVTGRDSADLVEAQAAAKRSAASWLMHNYLFFRIRLVNPDRFLTMFLPVVRWAFTPGYLVGLGGLALVGLFLISRQFDLYTHSLVELFTIDGLLWMGLALSATKVIHEMGHGFAAKRFGCRVPSMGIAFLVLWPVLWTDTTDAWRLADRRQRLAIDVAGVLAEISVAAAASILWAVLPDGPVRNAAFVLSSSTWILTLFINVSPLMRFDGYYVLSDALDIPNLQERGFAHARWGLRELLFRPRATPPESFSPAMSRILVAYALASWTYRFVLFTGIAVVVYHITFRSLGLVLMAVELWYFVTRPVLRELAVWARTMRTQRINTNTTISLLIMAAAVAILVVPWRDKIDAPGVLRAARQVTLYTNEPGRLLTVPSEAQRFSEGQAVFTLASPEVTHDLKVAVANLNAAEADLASRGFDPERRRAQQASFAAASAAAAAVTHAEARAAKLQVRAPFAGILTDISPGLTAGADLRRLEPLAVLIDPAPVVVEAYVAEADLPRLSEGASARFVSPARDTITSRVIGIARASTRELEPLELASIHGGPIAVRREQKGVLIPERALYRVLLAVEGDAPVKRRETGYVAIDAPAESLARVLYRLVVGLLRRESSM